MKNRIGGVVVGVLCIAFGVFQLVSSISSFGETQTTVVPVSPPAQVCPAGVDFDLATPGCQTSSDLVSPRSTQDDLFED